MPPRVCAGASHCSADASGDVRYVMRIAAVAAGSSIASRAPRNGSAAMHHERQRAAVRVDDRLDGEISRVEIERAAAGSAERQLDLGMQRAGPEVDARAQRERRGLDLGVVGVPSADRGGPCALILQEDVCESRTLRHESSSAVVV